MAPAGGPNGLKLSSKQSGSKPFSISMGNRPSTTNTRKRPHSTLDDGSDSDGDKGAGPQLLSGFDRSTGRAITENEPPEKKPLVITEQKNRDWRTEASRRRGKNLLPEEEQARRAGREVKQQGQTGDGDEEQKPTYGLLVAQRSKDGHRAAGSPDRMDTSDANPPAPRTADEEALEALLGNGTNSSSRVIEKAHSNNDDAGTWGGDANDFKSDVDTRPDVPSLSDYAAVPIEEFGRALMRGMGWKDGEELGKGRAGTGKSREVKMRPALLGIGAKEVPDGLEEMGAWGKGAKKSRRIDRSYMPLVMQNDKTGEKLTEDELSKRQQNETLIQSEKDERNDQKAITESDNGSARRHRDRNERNGHSSKRDDPDRSSSRRHHDYRDSDRERTDRDKNNRPRGDRRDDHESEKRRDREKSSRSLDDDRRRRKYDDRDRRDRDRDRERSRERSKRR